MALRLISPDGTQSFDLREGATIIVGRAPTCDIPVFDPTISRRHAELVTAGESLHVKDLGSSNGTFLNGAKIDEDSAGVDDLVAFGKVAFRVTTFDLPKIERAMAASSPAGATIVRQIPMRDANAGLAALGAPPPAPGGVTRIALIPPEAATADKNQQKLATLLEV